MNDDELDELLEDVDPEVAAEIRRKERLRENCELTPTVTVEVPEPLADYVLSAAKQWHENAGEDDDRTLEYRIETALLDFVDIHFQWVFPDGTVLGSGCDESAGDSIERP